MPIEKVILENFKTHVRTEIPLSPLTVLVGPNSVGKTSVLDGIRYVTSLRSSRRVIPVEEGERFLRRGADRLRVKLVISTSNKAYISRSISTESGSWVSECSWEADGTGRTEKSSDIVVPTNETRRILAELVGTTTQLRLETDRLAAPSRVQVGERTTRLALDGSGLAGVLSILRLFNEPFFTAIERDLRQIVPAVNALRIKKVPFTETRREYDEDVGLLSEHDVTLEGAALRFDFIGAVDIPAHEVSQGTLLVLGVLTAARAENVPAIVLLDDIERALHPRAQRQLVENLRTLVQSTLGLQIIATSHSPYLVDAFRPEEVIVLGLRKDGTAAARRLSDHPDAKRAMEVLSTGEFLAAEQEDWVVKETP
jgi:hypothetical protein